MGAMSQQTNLNNATDSTIVEASSHERNQALSELSLDTSMGLKGFDTATIEERVVGAVADKITAEISKPSFAKSALSFIGRNAAQIGKKLWAIAWQALNTKTGKIVGGVAAGLLALKFGAIVGQPFAGGILGAAIAIGGATKFNPYHMAIGAAVGVSAIAITSPLFLGVLGWGVAAAALPAAVHFAGKKNLWIPDQKKE